MREQVLQAKAPPAAAARGRAGPAAVRVQLLEHVEEALRTLEKAVAAARLRVALGKEEVALYKNEMAHFARAGVPHCDAATAALLQAVGGVRQGAEAPPAVDAHLEELLQRHGARAPACQPGAPVAGRASPGLGFIGDVSAQTLSMMDRMVHQANATLRQVRTQAADSALAAVLQTGIASTEAMLGDAKVPLWADLLGDGGGRAPTDRLNPLTAVRSTLKLLGGGSGDTSPNRVGLGSAKTAVPHFEYSAAEAAALEQENVQLLEEQRETTAQDAKQIEASVRELSQLTSLANEKVLEQNEQFNVVLNNTAITKSNIDKAGKEVREAGESFWTSTKQLIALLWCCIISICVLNTLIR
ncbi:syntaxin 1B/2/3 [Strigomonas culicis]|uniref:Syntaxin 1B/2/3 n=1 Tax=Strigomonas culicis TaxID=28005 RepID=S9TTC8_9TRYP|nr:syntaxin 1B/2/3 [Strigomonas culicis]|eukprot:EPY19783.1 syntaxin 1B/2/3 [Strigomonas culicis]